MQFKHLVNTPLESLIRNLIHFMSRYEISQRFYFIEVQPLISAEESLRFLKNNWMQKKIQVERKLLVKNERASGSGQTGVTGNKVLPKKHYKGGRGGLKK